LSSEEQAPENESTPAAQPVVKKAEAAKPRNLSWWRNTYFWLAGILFFVGILGLIGGPALIRDPGQKREDSLVTMLYFVGAIVMVVNGWVSHRQTLREFEEEEK